MQFPDFGYRSTSHARLTPDDRPHVVNGGAILGHGSGGIVLSRAA